MKLNIFKKKTKLMTLENTFTTLPSDPPSYLLKNVDCLKEEFENLNDEQAQRLATVLGNMDEQKIEQDRATSGNNEFSNDEELSIRDSMDPINQKRNRYSNVVPWDKNRVKLSVRNGHNDYINASWITLFGKKYIATQGPTPNTIDHFWQMVYSHTGDPAVIVMLTPLREGKVKKCEQYWPKNVDDSLSISSKGGFISGLKVSLLSEQFTPHYELRELELSQLKPYEPRIGPVKKKIYHFYFKSWADFDKPHEEASICELIEAVNSKNPPGSPLTVHCSAGIGRTGTYIAIDAALKATKDRDICDRMFIYNIVSEMRKQRMGMIQRPDQYVFVHEELRRIAMS
jgi:protein-tyrosine phosphatase